MRINYQEFYMIPWQQYLIMINSILGGCLIPFEENNHSEIHGNYIKHNEAIRLQNILSYFHIRN